MEHASSMGAIVTATDYCPGCETDGRYVELEWCADRAECRTNNRCPECGRDYWVRVSEEGDLWIVEAW